MLKYENDCVGCEVCAHCGRNKRLHVYCDHCKEEIDPEEVYECLEYEHVCLDCLARIHKVDCLEE